MKPEEVIEWLSKRIIFWEGQKKFLSGPSLGYRKGEIDVARRVIYLLSDKRKED